MARRPPYNGRRGKLGWPAPRGTAVKGQTRVSSESVEGSSAGSGVDGARTVLVVEDDPAISDMLLALLEAEGFHAELAPDGRCALDLFGAQRPDLITLDLSLPTVDGIEVLDRLSVNGAANVPIVVVSAYTERLAERHRRRAAAVVPKPFEIDCLLDSINAALEPVG